MKIRFALLTAALVAPQALAASDSLANEPVLSAKRLSGSLTAGYSTNYSGRGYVVSHAAVQGDSIGMAALQLSYDVGKEGLWSLNSAIAYAAPASGHTLYGNPTFPQGHPYHPRHIKECNIENELAIISSAKYTREKWNIAFGHDFIHGGLLGVMAKHYRDQGASVVQEVFIKPEWTPAPWVDLGVKTSFSFQGIHGWWFEPYATFKAPLIGTPEDVTVAARMTLAMSATADYFDSRYFACANGSQAFWIKFDFPWFVTEDKNFIITPGISFNWAGKGAMKANEVSEFREHTQDSSMKPFRNFGVVGSISATYRF